MNTIRIEVEVPADLDVSLTNVAMYRSIDSRGSFTFKTIEGSWIDSLGRQIAAAVEARKPRPPKFAVGDIIEWRWGTMDMPTPFAGTVRALECLPDGRWFYWIHHMTNKVMESDAALVRRAAK